MSKAGKLRVRLLIKQKRKQKSNSTSTALFIEHDSNKRAINKKGYVWFPRNCRKIKKNQEHQHSFSTNSSFFVLSFFEKLKKGCKKLNFLEKQTRKRQGLLKMEKETKPFKKISLKKNPRMNSRKLKNQKKNI